MPAFSVESQMPIIGGVDIIACCIFWRGPSQKFCGYGRLLLRYRWGSAVAQVTKPPDSSFETLAA